MSLLTTRKQAISSGAKFYFTGATCKNGHVSKRRTVNGRCEECRLIADGNGNKAQYHREYAAANRERLKAYKSNYRAENRAELSKREKEQRDPERNRIYQKKYGKKYRKENKPLINFWASNRRAAKIERTSSWLTETDNAVILAMYERARQLTKETGVEHHVDHIIPLQGSLVSGLHVPENLQILTAAENLEKSNSFKAAA